MAKLKQRINLGFFASHNGSNMQAVILACQKGILSANPRVVFSNNLDSGALKFAQDEGIPWKHFSSKTHPNPTELDRVICSTLQEFEVDLILLVGYMRLLGPHTISSYGNRILNIHPALLPKFGGKGMYGINVHKAVIAAGEKETGVTIHHANEHYDEGQIVAQCIVPVLPDDTPEALAARVLTREHSFLVEILQEIEAGKIDLDAEVLTDRAR